MGKWLESRQSKEIDLLSTATVTPSSVHTYYRRADGFHQSKRFKENQVHLKANRHKGELSDKAVKKIKSAIEWLLIRSTPQRVYNRQQDQVFYFRLNFITLTLPAEQSHSDKIITSVCLNNFLNICRNKFKVTDYIWKAEPQGNGRLHFHVTTNTFIHWRDVRKAWQSSVELLGYVSEFKKKFHHDNPNCTDIKKVKHIRKLAAYLSKYLAKNKSFSPIGELRSFKGKLVEVKYTDKIYRDEKQNRKQGVVIGTMLSERLRKVESNLWGCSQSISKCKNMSFDCNSMQWDGLMKILAVGKFKHIKSEYVSSFYGSVYEQAKLYSAGFYEDMRDNANMKDVNYRYTDDKILQYL